MKQIKGLVIHCSDSTFGSATLIDKWHRERGWDGIGYTAVICNGMVENNTYMPFMNGAIEWGRDWDKMGAHTLGFNDYEAICLIGESGKFTEAQIETLERVVLELINDFGLPMSRIYGHSDLDSKKPHCPGFSVTEFVRACINTEPLDKFVYQFELEKESE